MVCALHNSLFPDCEITPTSGDTVELLSMVESGVIGAALLTLPANGIGQNMHRFARDRLVVCMRSKDPAAPPPSDGWMKGDLSTKKLRHASFADIPCRRA